MGEERDEIVVLVDENGDEVEFEYIDSFEMNNNEYVVLVPLDEEIDEDEEEDEVIILRVEHNEDGEDSYVTIEDDDELDEVFSEFQSRLDEEYEQ